VALVQRPDDFAAGDVQCGEQRGRAGAFVVMRRALRNPGQHRQDRRGPVERLDLRLLIDAQHDRALGRIEVQADDVTDLVDEQRIW
jgi:hypothetical protein